MEYKLLSVRKDLPEVNIGDYVQALAASQYYPSINGFVERDEVGLYDGEECKVIMNGWYMFKPENWPPSKAIHPLFVAFHINSTVKDRMLTPESLDYLSKHSPIGCRDNYTKEMLLSKGINAYFSGCLTLTLGKKYHATTRTDEIYFVDPYFKTDWTLGTTLKSGLYLLRHFIPISIIARKYPERKSFFRKCMILTSFYREYSKCFCTKILTTAKYICQQSNDYNRQFTTNEALLQEAEKLIRNYAQARLVITSRIHCALPCLGLETPVIYTEDANQSEASACRLSGLRELLNIAQWKNGQLQFGFDWKEKITMVSEVPHNKKLWKNLAQSLEQKCETFIARNEQ